MYPNEATHTEELLEAIRENSPKVTDHIKELIDAHDTSKMEEGVRYYFNESDITKRKIETYENDVKVEDVDATNQKLPASWAKRLIDPKVSYLAGKPLTLSSVNEDDPYQERVEDTLGDDFDDTVPELIKHASNKGKEWLHPYIDSEGEFKHMIVSAMEYIPIIDKRTNEQIGGIRYYDLDEDTRKIELWDKDYVTYYEQIDGEVVMDVSVDVNPQSHFYIGDKGYAWERVPFIEFKNNEEAVNDLTFFKPLIDGYELINSDTENTIIDVQSIIWALKGYEGTSLEQFTTELKKSKAISLSDEPGAGAEAIQADIPTDAVDSHLDRLEKDIYHAAQSVNFDTDKFGQNPSGVALQFLYTSLDMKCQVLERKFQKSLRQLLWFVCEYLKIKGVKDINHKDYSFIFNKSMITNEKELIDNLNNSESIMSNETRRAKHPYVDDTELEKERIEQETSEYTRNMPDINGDD